MTPRRSGDNWLWVAVAITLAVSFTPWGPMVLYPFKLFTTWVHECSHALMTLLVGGRVSSIVIEPDTSGVTRSLIPTARFPRALVASAGYLGASFVGCLLMAATRDRKRAPAILWGIGAFMLVTLVVWMRNPFGVAVVLVWGLFLVMLSRRGSLALFVLSLLAVRVALDAVYDIRVLFLVHGQSDAETMAGLSALPAWLWASVWMSMSVAMLGWTLWISRVRK